MLGEISREWQKSAASIVCSQWRKAVEEELVLDVSCSSQWVAGSRHQLLRKSYWTSFIWKQSLRYYVSDAAAASNDDDVNAGNIPHELSQLSNLQMLGLSNNNLSGNYLFNINYCIVWLEQGSCWTRDVVRAWISLCKWQQAHR